MTAVENSIHNGPVKIGLGLDGQEAALLSAGAEKVFLWPRKKPLVLDIPGAAIRADDTILMVDPGAVPVADLRAIIEATGSAVDLQVIGNEPTRDLSVFRAQLPKVADVPVKARTGRPGAINYTLAQAAAIIRLWHQDNPKLRPPQVTEMAEMILGLEAGTLKPHWVRDLVIKFVGTARRERPEDWPGIFTNDEQESGEC